MTRATANRAATVSAASPVLAPASIPTVDSAKDPVGVAPMRPLMTDVAESAFIAFSHLTFPSSSIRPALSPVAIRVPVLSKNWTKAKDITATTNSTLRRSEVSPSKNAPTGGAVGIDTMESGMLMSPKAMPTIAVTIIPKNTAPVIFLAYMNRVMTIQNRERMTTGSEKFPIATMVSEPDAVISSALFRPMKTIKHPIPAVMPYLMLGGI